MILRSLILRQFRNYEALEQSFTPALTVLLGANAQGKTSLLEGIYLLATGKSLRGCPDVEMIRWDMPAGVVSGHVLREKAHDVELEVALSQTARKSLVVNTVRTPRAMEFVGQFKVVAFSSADLETIRGEPSRRRRFLDLEISQLSPSYCHALGCYRKILEQRNRLLKQPYPGNRHPLIEDSLGAWDDQLRMYGSRLIKRRRQFIQQLEMFAQPIHQTLSGGKEQFALSYHPTFRLPPPAEGDAGDHEAIGEAFRRAQESVREEERRRQVSLIGPHRDDMTLLVNGRDVRVFGSQGQQRSAALSLRLAEVALMEDLTGEAPTCLLDDVFSELDTGRRAHLFEVTKERCQTFVSTTDLTLLPGPVQRHASLFEVQEGTLRPLRCE